ncbi:TPA: hypothetical protein DCZ15_02045 [Candidatus Falkowbacteria bacterium]|nr:MAG: hypothetical protein UV95_C0001G0197 [Candidatus Falkowbacteria bacterium GW2011_GWF2_43_32]HBA36636.1 hypothetical protein [Candidatus Falkowbacteria bacterium]
MKKILILMLIAMAAIVTSCEKDPPVIIEPDPDPTEQYPDSAIIIIQFTVPPLEGYEVVGSGMALINNAITDILGPISISNEFNGSDTMSTLVISKDEMENFFNTPVDINFVVAAQNRSSYPIQQRVINHRFYDEKITDTLTVHHLELTWD